MHVVNKQYVHLIFITSHPRLPPAADDSPMYVCMYVGLCIPQAHLGASKSVSHWSIWWATSRQTPEGQTINWSSSKTPSWPPKEKRYQDHTTLGPPMLGPPWSVLGLNPRNQAWRKNIKYIYEWFCVHSEVAAPFPPLSPKLIRHLD